MFIDVGSLLHSYNKVRRIVVLGNSGSLLETPKQQDWKFDIGHSLVREPLIIGVNRQLRKGIDGRIYDPDLLVISDSRAFESDRELLEKLPCNSMRTKVLVPQWVARDVEPLKNMHVYTFQATTDGFDGPNTADQRREIINGVNIASKIGDPLLSICNVSFHALQIACVLQPEKIYLLGMEGRWATDDKRKSLHHFYDDGEITSGNLKPFPLSFEFHEQWQRIKDKFDNINIVDLTPWRDVSSLCFNRGKAKVLLGTGDS